MMKSISSGLILTDGDKFLGCHSTGNYFYDLPKGSIEEGELPIEACIREVREETGLIIDPSDLTDLGEFDYNHYKNLHLFILFTVNLPQLENLKCNSFFYDPVLKKDKPEADGFKYIAFNNMQYYLTKNMYNLLSDVSQLIKCKQKQPL